MGALDNRHTECLTGAWLGASHRHWLSAHVRIEPSCGQPPVKISPRRTVGYRPRTASHFAHGNGFHRASVFDENEPCVNHVRVSAYLLSIKLSAKVTHLTVCGSVAWVRFEHGFEFRQHELPPSFAALRQSSPCIRLTSRNTKGTPPSQPCSQRNDVCNVACKCSRRYYYNILNGYPSPPHVCNRIACKVLSEGSLPPSAYPRVCPRTSFPCATGRRAACGKALGTPDGGKRRDGRRVEWLGAHHSAHPQRRVRWGRVSAPDVRNAHHGAPLEGQWRLWGMAHLMREALSVRSEKLQACISGGCGDLPT